MNFYTSNKELVMIPLEAFSKNPKCNLDQKVSGSMINVSISLKPDYPFRIRKRNGEITEEFDLSKVRNVIGVEFETYKARHYFTMGNTNSTFYEGQKMERILSVVKK